MEYRTFIMITMLVIYVVNQFMWYEITEVTETKYVQVWMREVAIVVTVFVVLALISISAIQKVQGLDCKCH